MPQPRRRLNWGQFRRAAQGSLRQLDSPQYKAEALQEDLSPHTWEALQQALADRRHQNPVAQRALMDEKQRLEAVQAQQVAQAAQQFPQRLAAGLDLSQRTGEPPLSQTPEAFMAKLMLQMQRRYPGMGGGGGPVAQGDY